MPHRHRLLPLLIAAMLLAPGVADRCAAAVIWSGPTVEFTKAAFADPTLAENQDRLTDDVWITRGDIRGIYNAAQEAAYSGPSPAGTLWSYGTTDDLASLTFSTWATAVQNNPPASIGPDMVLHLVDADAYVDITFTSFVGGSSGGGSFSYVRSTPPGTPGDYNGDGQINGADYDAWNAAYGDAVDPSTGADGNGDGFVNAADYTVWRDAVVSPAVAIPEPGAALLVVLITGWGLSRTR